MACGAPGPSQTANPSPVPSVAASATSAGTSASGIAREFGRAVVGPVRESVAVVLRVHRRSWRFVLAIARRYRTTGRSIAYWNRDTYPSLDPDSKDLLAEQDRDRLGKAQTHPGRDLGRSGRAPQPTCRAPYRFRRGAGRPRRRCRPTALPCCSNGRRDSFCRRADVRPRRFENSSPPRDIINWLIENDVPATMFETEGSRRSRQPMRVARPSSSSARTPTCSP